MEILVVEDDKQLRKSIKRTLLNWGANVITVDCIAEAKRKLAPNIHYDLVILDINLPDGSGVELVETLNTLNPIPHIIAVTDKATPFECYRLGELGITGFIPKPFSLTDFGLQITSLLEKTPQIKAQISNLVGKVKYTTFFKRIRHTMLMQALSMHHGNKTHAAALLGVSRQAVQQMINEFEIDVSLMKR